MKVEILQLKGDRFMYIDDYLWMWDTLQEKELQKDLADCAYGDVLVAGYGFGLLPEYLLERQKVKSVTIVEKYEEVIEKMKKTTGQIFGDIIIDDFFNVSEDKKYDCVIGDIWPDITAKFLDDYLKFKDKALSLLKTDGVVLAWGKDYFEYLDGKNRGFTK